MRALISRTVAVGTSVMLAACGGDDGFSPTVETVAGSYSATIFTLTTSAGTTNLLAAGALVSVTLAADGTTTGQLFVPAAQRAAAISTRT
jgi:spore maturation protein SpmB